MTLGIDDLTLGIHNVIVFQDALSCPEMTGFHIFLGVFHSAGQDLGIDGGILVQAQGVHHAHDPVGGEQAHQVILQAQVEPALTGGC